MEARAEAGSPLVFSAAREVERPIEKMDERFPLGVAVLEAL
jgi:hypothetical protein